MTVIVSSSEFGSLQLTDIEYLHYKHDEKELFKKYYLMQRAKSGIWATNQNKYVKSRSELNSFDSKYAEDNYVEEEN